MLRLVLMVLWLLFGFISGAKAIDPAQINGVWTGTFSGPYEETMFLDVFYWEGDYLYTMGDVFCGSDESSIRFKKTGDSSFSLDSSVYCYGLTVASGTLSFSGSHVSIHIQFEWEGRYYDVTGNGYKVQDERIPLNSSRQVSGSEDSLKVFSIEVPSNTSYLEITTYGGTGDSDLYVIYSKPPYYLHSSEDDYTDEYIYIDYPAEGTWYIVVYGFESYRDVTLNVYAASDTFQSSPTPAPPIETGPFADIMLDYWDDYSIFSYYDRPLITLSLEPQNYNGRPADWWLILASHSGFKYFDLSSMSFKDGFKVTYQGNLIPLDFIDLIKLNLRSLPPDDYILYFGVDLNQNGQLDIDSLIYDYVIFSVM